MNAVHSVLERHSELKAKVKVK